MPQASNPPLDDLQPRPVPRFKAIDSAQRLLDVLNPHGDLPPIQNAGDRFGECGAGQTRDRQGAGAIANKLHDAVTDA